MARSIPYEEGGSATGVLITGKSHGLGCDTQQYTRQIADMACAVCANRKLMSLADLDASTSFSFLFGAP